MARPKKAKTEEKIEEKAEVKTEEKKETETAEAKAETAAAPEAAAAETEAVVEEAVEKPEASEEEYVKKLTRAEEMRASRLSSWVPKTRLGKELKEGKITSIKEIFDNNRKILEAEVVDSLLTLSSDLIAIGQSKGKFGGGKRRAWRQTQKKTAEGNQASFACMCVVGDNKNYVGLGYGKAKETLPSREKAERNAKLNLIRVRKGCGSFDCSCNEDHSIPFRVEGKCGSAKMVLMPAPRGTGLAIEGECKKILIAAGIKDIYSKTFGQTRTKINLAKACFEALKNLDRIKK